MKYLLDTHVVDWAVLPDARLSAQVRTILSEAQRGDLAISDVSLTELARLLRSKAIDTPYLPEEWLRRATEHLVIFPVTRDIALRAAYLDWKHRDTCDRHIVATAAEHKLPLLTIDENIHHLAGVRGLKAIW